MPLTPYHAAYLAHALTRRCASDSADKLAGALVDAKVDLNPHQVEAALFAFRSPFSKGALLADEVGLGKTIEAGLVLSQRWAERKRRLLVIAPANLRKQWFQELQEKFFLPCRILEKKSFDAALKAGNFRPFEAEGVVICSYQFACSKADAVHCVPWDLVVMDEAHRLRNVYKPENKTANTLRRAFQPFPKLLLTATPLQNSLLELYGLMSFMDEHAFGSMNSFREQFARGESEESFAALKARIKPFCHRTLRRQVEAYVKYTKRQPMVQPFTPEEGEDRLYEEVSEYLRRENLQALPNGQRALITLVLRKLLASSTHAIAGALETMIARLQAQLAAQETLALGEALEADYESLEETEDEWDDAPEPMTASNLAAIREEISELEGFRQLALSIPHNAKGKALVTALDRAFAEAGRLGAAHKAIIFTESRRTQDYLLRVLADSSYGEGIVLFNGSNNDLRSREIYTQWAARHAGTDKITGSKTADMRSALVDYFRENGRIMIATEAAAEGINLQFCSLVVNYDLPWNPQRVEQRIGRCHRYGQKHDVVVVNFLNQKNEADQRVFQLLSEKFKLFEGVFGASDEVLGAIESGVDFEKRIAGIYQNCRTPKEIADSFDRLQADLRAEIDDAMKKTRRTLFENFDDEVREKLRLNQQHSAQSLGRFEQMLMALTRQELDGFAEFQDDNAFHLRACPPGVEAELGFYELPRRSGDSHLYRLGHPLAAQLIAGAKARPLPPAEIVFELANHAGKVSSLAALKGKSGSLSLTLLTVEALDQTEDHLILAGQSDDGQMLDEDVLHRFFSIPAKVGGALAAVPAREALAAQANAKTAAIRQDIAKRNLVFFEAEADKLDGWADDLKAGLEREIKDFDRQIKEAKRAASVSLSLEEKLAGQRRVKGLETERNNKRKTLFEAQDKIDAERERLIAGMEGKLKEGVVSRRVFEVGWRVE